MATWCALAACLELFGSGCSALEMRRSGLTRRLARQEVVEDRAVLGDDEIHYWYGGEGQHTVLFIHGFGADALWQWHPQLKGLAPHYRVLAPDLLWFGESSSQTLNYSIEHQARAIVKLLDHLGIHQVHVVGLSYGGMVAHELVGLAPDRIGRVVLVSSPARAFMKQDQEPLMHRYGVGSMEELLLPDEPSDVKRLMALAYADPPKVPRFIRNQIVEKFYAPKRDHLLRLLQRIEEDTGSQRARYQAPGHATLILWGLDDQIFPALAAQRLTGELGGHAQLCVLDDAGHAPHLEQPGAFNKLALDFLHDGRVDCEVAAAIPWRKP